MFTDKFLILTNGRFSILTDLQYVKTFNCRYHICTIFHVFSPRPTVHVLAGEMHPGGGEFRGARRHHDADSRDYVRLSGPKQLQRRAGGDQRSTLVGGLPPGAYLRGQLLLTIPYCKHRKIGV